MFRAIISSKQNMSIVERIIEQRENPISEERLQAYLTEMRALMQSFYEGKIDSCEMNRELVSLRERHDQIPSRDFVRLDYRGPMYGVFRRIGLSVEDARNMADHERAHWIRAEQEGFRPYALFGSTWSLVNGRTFINNYGFVEKCHARVDLKDGELAEALLRVTAAPDEPSEEDFIQHVGKDVQSQGIISREDEEQQTNH